MPETLLGQSPLTVLILVPLVVGALVWLVPPLRRLARPIGLVVSLLVLAGAVAIAAGFDISAAGDVHFTQTVSWIAAFGASYAVGVDGLGLVMVLLSALLVPVVLLAGWNEVTLPDGVGGGDADAERKALDYRRAGWVALILALEALMIAVFVAQDIFFFYVVFEAMLIPVYFLIGVYGGANRRYAAIKFLLYSLFGGMLMLAAVIGYFFVGTDQGPQALLLEQAVLHTSGGGSMPLGTEMLLFLGFFIAFAIKAPLVPLHTWLPVSGAEGPIGTTVLLVGILDKVGTFGFLRYCLPIFPDASRNLAPLVLVLAVIGIFYAAFQAIGQDDVKKLVTYTSIAHFGYIALGIFVFTTQGGAGAVLYMFNHGIATGLLLLAVGMIVARGRSRQISQYSGLFRAAPLLAGITVIAGMAGLALPGTNSFVSEFMVLIGSYGREPVFTILATIGIVWSALYVLWLIQRMLHGPARGVVPSGADDESDHDGVVDEEVLETDGGAGGTAVQQRTKTTVRVRVFGDLTTREKWVLGPLTALVIGIGFYPQPLFDIINPAVEHTLQTDVGIDNPGAPVNASANGDGK